MGSLKDALKKAGFSSTKNENDRQKTRKKEMTKAQKAQYTRTFCEVCEGTFRDVERYKHRNPTTDAQWICVGCADKLMIEDRFRVTAQSDTAKSGQFRRYYGETIKLDPNMANKDNRGPKRVDGNRSDRSSGGHQKGGNRSGGNRNYRKSGGGPGRNSGGSGYRSNRAQGNSRNSNRSNNSSNRSGNSSKRGGNS